MSKTLIKNANIATFNKDYGFGQGNPYGQILGGWLAFNDDCIEAIGRSEDECPLDCNNVVDAEGAWITPGLIDCHTHLVYAGNRSDEFEKRLNGVSYEEIARAGGGIISTVNSVRSASVEQLFDETRPRLEALISEGVTSLEIKSGYGLDLENERKMLKVSRKLSANYGIEIQNTYLAAHATAPEYKGRDNEYIDKVCDWMEALYDEGLIDAVDSFMENIAFNHEQIKRVFERATKLGLPVKLHAEQMSNMEGSALVASYRGLSSDHIERLSQNGVEAMARSGTVAVLLPTAFYTLRDTKVPPIDSLRASGVPMAVSTDSNPGTSPSTSILLAMNMACTLFRLTPEEALAGSTLYAAKALGWSKFKGQIAIGFDADLVMWSIARPADLSYQMGLRPIKKVWIKGIER